MSDLTISPSGPSETVLPAPDPEALRRLAAAGDDREAVAAVVSDRPLLLEGWARLGEILEAGASDAAGRVGAYAAYRVGYHRGLDQLRKHGWRGSGHVRWAHEENRGFLRCLDGLGRMAGAIGEHDEEERCAEFLRMLDPDRDGRA